MRNPKECLRDILKAVARIEKYKTQERTAFENNERIQVWMVHHLQIIGDAAA